MVVNVPYGMRGGIPEYGGRFAAQALVMATKDGHPRAIAYVSRIPNSTLAAIKKHAFYSYLIKTQHFTFAPVTVPAHRGGPAVVAPVGQESVVLHTADRRPGRRRAPGRPDAAYRVGRGLVLKPGYCAIFAPDRLPLCLPGGQRLGLPPRPLILAGCPSQEAGRHRPSPGATGSRDGACGQQSKTLRARARTR